jgi:hypothetical protein
MRIDPQLTVATADCPLISSTRPPAASHGACLDRLQQMLQMDLHLQNADPRSTVAAPAAAATIPAFCSRPPLNRILGGCLSLPHPNDLRAPPSPAPPPPAHPPPLRRPPLRRQPANLLRLPLLCPSLRRPSLRRSEPPPSRLLRPRRRGELQRGGDPRRWRPTTTGELRPRRRPSSPPHGGAAASLHPRTAMRPFSTLTSTR